MGQTDFSRARENIQERNLGDVHRTFSEKYKLQQIRLLIIFLNQLNKKNDKNLGLHEYF